VGLFLIIHVYALWLGLGWRWLSGGGNWIPLSLRSFGVVFYGKRARRGEVSR
jgi:hypothetical protein